MKFKLLSQIMNHGIQLKEFAYSNNIEFIERHHGATFKYHLKKDERHAIVEMPYSNNTQWIDIWRNSIKGYNWAYYCSNHTSLDFLEFLTDFFKD